MFAATLPNTDRVLETFKLGLLLESKNQTCPKNLKDYFQQVIEQSLALFDKPKSNAASALPEAVSLAVKYSTNKELHTVLTSLLSEASRTSELAKTALQELENTFDPNCESAHFSPEIYAAI